MTTIYKSTRSTGSSGGDELGPGRPLPKGVVGISPGGRSTPAWRRDDGTDGTLIVGQGIQMAGEIESCRTLVVEGRVEASVRANVLEVLEGGVFTGTGEFDRAQVAGTVEGTLTVHEQLSIVATGRVSGKIRYGRIVIEAGGEISGEVAAGASAESGTEGEASSLAATAS